MRDGVFLYPRTHCSVEHSRRQVTGAGDPSPEPWCAAVQGVLQCRVCCAWSSPTESLPFMVSGACGEFLVEQAPGSSLVDLWERCGANQVVSDFGWL